MKKSLIISVLVIIIIVIVGFYWYQRFTSQNFQDRTPADQNLKTYVDDKTGLTFEYPDQLQTKYINVVAWPPKAEEVKRPFACAESGSEVIGEGKTAKRTINGRDYCVTKMSEGAAGSIYTTYTYAFPYNNTTITLDFTLRSVQCGNYDEPQKTVCEEERSAFNPDNVADQMAQSLTFKIQ